MYNIEKIKGTTNYLYRGRVIERKSKAEYNKRWKSGDMEAYSLNEMADKIDGELDRQDYKEISKP